jgi:hypothetical protein
MKKWIAAICAILVCTAAAPAEPQDACAVPGYLLFGDAPLERVAASANKEKKLKIVVLGTASAMLPGPDGTVAAFPARLEATLKRRLPKVEISLVTQTKPRQTAAEMSESIDKLIVDEKPNLVIWQTGTYDAMKGVDPEDFRSSISDGVESLHTGGADVVLVNMQYSPRTESMISLGAYLDNMRWVAREREIPLFDRNAIMRHWNDVGAIDLYAATKDVGMAKRVHECIGRALAAMIVDGAHLEALEAKPAQ